MRHRRLQHGRHHDVRVFQVAHLGVKALMIRSDAFLFYFHLIFLLLFLNVSVLLLLIFLQLVDMIHPESVQIAHGYIDELAYVFYGKQIAHWFRFL